MDTATESSGLNVEVLSQASDRESMDKNRLAEGKRKKNRPALYQSTYAQELSRNGPPE
jgi:hypothetical protein